MLQTLQEITPPQTHKIWQLLQQVTDPEIPVLNIVELGMIRQVSYRCNSWVIHFTPTYSACPATEMLLDNIKQILQQRGFAPVTIEIVLFPPWSTDWLSGETKRRMQEYGIAPPNGTGCTLHTEQDQPLQCPHCGHHQVSLVSEFGSTACKAHYRCNHCLEPFDYFKCI